MKHRPRKRFGQNFLTNRQIIHQILQVINPQPMDNMVEIGPGLGALTEHLLPRLDALTAIEIDRDLHTQLQQMPWSTEKLTLIGADALTVDYGKLGEQIRVIGNLPYNISTPLLLHLFHYIPHILDMHFMLQKEVVDRIVAKPGCKAYGRLSIIIQYHCDAEALFDVPPDSFYPQPKVDSAFVRLIPHQHSPYPAVDLPSFERFIACAFATRRKTLANNLKSILSADKISALGIDPTLRPEQINITEYVQLAKFVNK